MTMRGVIVREWTEFENLQLEHNLPTEPVNARQVRIAIKASGVSFALTLFVSGRYQRKPPLAVYTRRRGGGHRHGGWP